jgi:hypothetical protein
VGQFHASTDAQDKPSQTRALAQSSIPVLASVLDQTSKGSRGSSLGLVVFNPFLDRQEEHNWLAPAIVDLNTHGIEHGAKITIGEFGLEFLVDRFKGHCVLSWTLLMELKRQFKQCAHELVFVNFDLSFFDSKHGS